MRLAVAFIAAALLAIPTASHAIHTDTRVSLAVTTASVRDTPYLRSDVLLLWNRAQRREPVGHAVKSCIKTSNISVSNGGILHCSMTIVLPLGKVTATGIVHNLRRYTLVVTGGTGAYVDAHGPLFMRSVSGNGVRRLTFWL